MIDGKYKIVISRALNQDVYEIRVWRHADSQTQIGQLDAGRLYFSTVPAYGTTAPTFMVEARDEGLIDVLIAGFTATAHIWTAGQ